MPATALRCRVCETQYPLDPIGVCARCFGPLDPVYDRDEQLRTVTRESIAAGPPSIWRYEQLLPVEPPPDQRLPVGWTPLVRVPRLAESVGVGELWLKLDTANPTHSWSRSRPRRRSRSAERRSPAPRPETSRTRSPRAPQPKASTLPCSVLPTSSPKS